MAEQERFASDDKSKVNYEDANSTFTTGQLMVSAMLESSEFLFDDPLTTTPANECHSEKGSVVEDDELLFQQRPEGATLSSCPFSLEQPKTDVGDHLKQQGCIHVKKTKVIPTTTSDETVTLSTEFSDLPVPAVVYIFRKVPTKPANRLRTLSKSMRIKMGFQQKLTLDEDDPEVYKETLIDL